MQTSTIKFSQIEDRIDAEYYKPEYLEVKEKLDKSKGVKFLGDIVNVIMNGVEFRTYSLSGKPYLRVSDIKEIFMDLSDVKYIPENIEFSKNTELLGGDVLTSRSGTLGISAIAPKAGSIISSHLIRISPKKEINSYYLVVFLNSRYGRLQILQKNNGAVVPEINQPSLKSLKIPIPSQSFQQKIEKMVKGVQEKRKLADGKYKEAEEILNKELGLEDLDLSTQKTFEAKFSEAGDRFDPEYYKPIYKNVYKYLKKKSKPLTEVCKIIKTKISPQNNPEKIFNYIEIGGINNSTGEIEKVLNLRGWEVPSGVKYVVKNNDVLLSAVRTYLKGIALVNNNHEGDIATTGFHVLREPIIKPETLFLFLRSRVGLIQFEKFFLGSTYPVIKGYDLKNIMIPILSQPLQQKISSLIQESFKLRQEAKELIDRAKKDVEEMVERN